MSDIAHIKLNTAQVAQLKHLGSALSGIDHGSVISEAACRELIELNLACKDSKSYFATNSGLHWLRCAEYDAIPFTVTNP